MCNYEMVFMTPYCCTEKEVVALEKVFKNVAHFSIPFRRDDELREYIPYACLLQTEVMVHTSPENRRAHANVGAAHLHRRLPVARHAHAQLQRRNLAVLRQQLAAKIGQLLRLTLRRQHYLEVGLWGSVQLAYRHQAHEVQIGAAGQDELREGNALLGKTSTLPTHDSKHRETTSPLRWCGPPRTRSAGQRAQPACRRSSASPPV